MTTNQLLQERRGAAVAQGVATAHPFYAARAENAELWDVEGNRFIDFAVGIAVCNTGHCHPAIMAAAKAQCDLFTHTAFQVSAYESYIHLAERLNELAPIDDARSVFFSTGAEAVENAVKIARAATGRDRVGRSGQCADSWIGRSRSRFVGSGYRPLPHHFRVAKGRPLE